MKGSESQVASLLAAILGPSNGGYVGGTALARQVGSYNTTPAMLADWTPSFVAAGWMPDSENDQTVSQGTLWIALRFRAALPQPGVARFGAKLMREAAVDAGFAVGRTSGQPAPRLMADLVAVQVARSDADPDLQAAAIGSVQGLSDVASFFGLVLGGLGSIASSAKNTVKSLQSASAMLQRAVQAVSGIQQTATQVQAAVDMALAAPPEQALDQQTQLNTLGTALSAMASDVRQAVQVAPQVRADHEAQRDAIVKSIRDDMVAKASALTRSPIGLAKEAIRCMYLAQADRQFGSFKEEARTALSDAKSAADFLVANAQAVDAALATLGELQERVQYALDQLPLSPLMRDYLGVPGWGWLLGGGVVLVGGAAGIRAYRRRRTPKPNARRRRTRRTSR